VSELVYSCGGGVHKGGGQGGTTWTCKAHDVRQWGGGGQVSTHACHFGPYGTGPGCLGCPVGHRKRLEVQTGPESRPNLVDKSFFLTRCPK